MLHFTASVLRQVFSHNIIMPAKEFIRLFYAEFIPQQNRIICFCDKENAKGRITENF